MNLFPIAPVAGPEAIADAAMEYVAARLAFVKASPRVDARKELDAAWDRLLVVCGERADGES